MKSPQYYLVRKPLNDQSREQAISSYCIWDDWEVDLILDWNMSEEELTDLSCLLGRTREGVRQKYYSVMRDGKPVRPYSSGRSRTVRVSTHRTTNSNVSVTYHYSNWSQEDCSEFYI